MKPILTAIIVAITGLGVCVSEGAILAEWTFETSVPTTAGPHAAEGGIYSASSSAIGFHADGLTVWSNPVGNGSGESFSATRWSVGDYFQFSTSSVGFNSVIVTFSAVGSATGPRDFKLAYSTDGNSFLDFDTYSLVSSPSWSSTTTQTTPDQNFAFDLSGVTALDNQGAIFFRLINTTGIAINGDPVATGGTSRVDDFSIQAVPEPAEWGLICALGLLGVCGLHTWRERRRAVRQSSSVS